MKRTKIQRRTPLRRSKPPAKRRKPKTRRYTKAAAKRRKNGEWSTKTADTHFSIFIRDRDGKCCKCGTKENLTCSHYHRRGHSATRYEDENCIALCKWCHAEWEGPKAEYTEYMLNWLGVERFAQLAILAGQTVKRADAVADWKRRYDEYRSLST